MPDREKITEEFSNDELEALVGEELPDRKAMSTVNCDPSEFAALGLGELGPEPDSPET